MTLQELAPQIAPWVRTLPTVWPGPLVAPWFALWQVPHILGMAVLGGTSLLMSLRLIGLGLTEETPSEVRRNLWPWLSGALGATVASGVLTGMVNAERLYESAAFPPKMLALLAGVIITYGAVGPVARSEGRVVASAMAAGLAALFLWASALALLASADLVSPGVFHVIVAAGLLVLLAIRGRPRWVYATGLVTLVAGQTLVTHGLIRPDDYAGLDPVNMTFAGLLTAWILGAAAWQMVRQPRADSAGGGAALVGYVSILIWVTVAAAGRWIGFA